LELCYFLGENFSLVSTYQFLTGVRGIYDRILQIESL